MKAIMPAEKMIDMFTYKITSTQSIVDISEKLPTACLMQWHQIKNFIMKQLLFSIHLNH